jgi:hypothetical protein
MRLWRYIKSYGEAGGFVANTPGQIPEGRKTVVTVLDKAVNRDKAREAYKKLWDEIENSDEVLEGEPEHLRFRTPEETEAL